MNQLNKILTYNLSTKSELVEILENATGRYNNMIKQVQYQSNLQRECGKVISQQRNQLLAAQRNAYLTRFHAAQFIYVIIVAGIFIWSYFYIPKFLNVKKIAKIEMTVKLSFVAVLGIHVIIIILSTVLPTRPWIRKNYNFTGI